MGVGGRLSLKCAECAVSLAFQSVQFCRRKTRNPFGVGENFETGSHSSLKATIVLHLHFTVVYVE